jgi:ABC-type multidrug transport system fused ATPase/permease subunit
MIGWLASRAARLAARVLGLLVLTAVLLGAAPVTLVAGASAWVAWLRGLPPRRLYREALWLGPMVAAWLAAIAVASGAWQQVAAAPYLAWTAMWRLAAEGAYPRAAVLIAPIALPLGLAAGGLAWSYRTRAMASAAGGASAGSAVSFDLRQWRHQVRAAAARIAVPGAVPLTTAAGDVVVGAVIRAIGHPATPLARLRYERLRSHQVVIGGTGTGKTTLIPLLTRLLPRLKFPLRRCHVAMTGSARLVNPP